MRETLIDKKIMLAPLAGVTDTAFRVVCEKNGCDKTFTEMVSVNALAFDNKATEEIMFISDMEKNANIQIFGSDVEKIKRVVEEKINPRKEIKEISFNMGCPAPKIFNNGEGSALLKDPSKVYKITKALKDSTDKIVNIKYRLGVDDTNIKYIENGKAMEEAGADYLILHARTRKAMYSGHADWQAIKNLKKEVSIPVIANGDIFTPEDFVEAMKITGADGAMIARGAMGNPFIFRYIKEYLKNGTYEKVTFNEIISQIKEHYELALKFKDERLVINQMRKHVGWYIKGLYMSSEYRDRVNKIHTSEEIFDLLDEYKKILGDYNDRKKRSNIN
ncbi:tRNA dihydrouridine synthase DusB [uncultured Anaerococcus sp.]|uniref:tRNA dihydrouridine synthase DusB n=1 Tax=uncultured Anaerococcus sp. TaxID=293428 RepID=UPI0026101FF2|nr:tRNA dihydrouridine synthase DusB [uncultured Anaerococcus sp.]